MVPPTATLRAHVARRARWTVALALAACAHPEHTGQARAPTPDDDLCHDGDADSAEQSGKPTDQDLSRPDLPSPAGGPCGGVAGYHCAEGLTCEMTAEEEATDDGMGTCRAPSDPARRPGAVRPCRPKTANSPGK